VPVSSSANDQPARIHHQVPPFHVQSWRRRAAQYLVQNILGYELRANRNKDIPYTSRLFRFLGPIARRLRMKFRFPIVIIDEDYRSENTSGWASAPWRRPLRKRALRCWA
jgi:hypothetical protein